MASITQYITHLLAQSQESFQHLGALGVLIYSAGIVVLGAAMVPLSPFAMAAGAIFGFWGGFIAITIGTNIASAVNFLAARYVFRKAISRRLAKNEKFRLIDAAVGHEGGKIITLLRLCPLPYGLANYCYGLTAIRLWPYSVATFFGIIPANCFFVWLGASTHTFTAGKHESNPGEKILLGIGLVAGFCALSYITRLAKAAVEKAEHMELAWEERKEENDETSEAAASGTSGGRDRATLTAEASRGAHGAMGANDDPEGVAP